MAADLDRLLSDFTRSAWRLETREDYLLDEEEPLLVDFFSGREVPRRPAEDAWLATLDHARGRRFSRVRLVQRPLTMHVRFELTRYRDNVAHGEDVRIADRSEFADELFELGQDFWVFDDRTVAVLSYDASGSLRGAELAADPSMYLRKRKLANGASVPYDEFMRR